MKILSAILVATVLTLGAGCAKPDWIDRTQVTADVTGHWHGRSYSQVATALPEVWLDLVQDGPKAKGRIRTDSLGNGSMPSSGPVEASIAGSEMTLKQTNGSIAGRFKISGDEMSGDIVNDAGKTVPITLQRTGPPALPAKE